MKETLLILLVMISASCSGKTTDGKTYYSTSGYCFQ